MVMRKWLLLVIQFMLVVSSTHQLSECVLVHSRQPKFLWFFFFFWVGVLGGGVVLVLVLKVAISGRTH